MSDDVKMTRRQFLDFAAKGVVCVTLVGNMMGVKTEHLKIAKEEDHALVPGKHPVVRAGLPIEGLASLADVGKLVYAKKGVLKTRRIPDESGIFKWLEEAYCEGGGATLTYYGDPDDLIGHVARFIEKGFGEVMFYQSQHIRLMMAEG